MNDSTAIKTLLNQEIEKREHEISLLKGILHGLDKNDSPLLEKAAMEQTTEVVSAPQTPATKVPRRKLSKKRKGSLIYAVMSLLNKQKRFMDSRELSEIIGKKYPKLVKDGDKFEKYLAVVLSNYKRKGELSGIKKNHKGEKLNRTFWGVYNWVDTEGNPLETIKVEA